MKMIAISAAALLVVAPCFAQAPPPALDSAPPRPPMFGRGPFALMRPVTNAPYSATFTSTATEKLQDGTVLTHTSTRVETRDSLGRTREEITRPASRDGKQHTEVVIADPVAHTITRLETERKIAVVNQIPEPRPDFDGPRRRAGAPSAPDAGAPPQDDARGHRGRNVVVADLGSKTIDGVVATGKRVTRTVPAGAMGNSEPIVITQEEWFSPDLKIELSRSDVDPFSGTRSTSVSSLTKAEPDAGLFKVPEGYTVQQAPERAGRRGFGGPRRAPGAPPSTPAGM